MKKIEKARRIAAANVDLPDDELRTMIKEQVPCKRTTALKAIKWARSHIREKEDAQTLEVAPKPPAQGEKLILEPSRELEEIEPPAEILEEPPTGAKPPEIKVFKNMLRSTHLLFIGKDGLLPDKYARPKEHVIETSDQLYLWLEKRVGTEQLESYDTVILGLTYFGLIAPIGWEYVKERRRESEREKKKIEKQKLANS